MVNLKRVYEKPSRKDGFRVLVERLWPRGVSKDHAAVDLWLKDVAPSTKLRQWYGHDPAKFDEFRRRYLAELTAPGPAQAVAKLRALAQAGPVTLLTATRELDISQAAVLAGVLREQQ